MQSTTCHLTLPVVSSELEALRSTGIFLARNYFIRQSLQASCLCLSCIRWVSSTVTRASCMCRLRTCRLSWGA